MTTSVKTPMQHIKPQSDSCEFNPVGGLGFDMLVFKLSYVAITS